jgi:hypothetical protein
VGAGSNAGPHFFCGASFARLIRNALAIHCDRASESSAGRDHPAEPRDTNFQFARWGYQVAAAIMPPERRARRSTSVFRTIAALTLASATAHPAATLLPSSPWWEKVTVTISGDGKPQSCRFESSLKPNGGQTCDVTGNEAGFATSSSSGAKDQYTRVTFERRFQPGAQPATDVQPGETFLGGQVMALGIDPHGAVKTCKIISQSGTMRPEYGCDQATTERFEASVANAHSAEQREGYMTIVVYGHSEHVV